MRKFLALLFLLFTVFGCTKKYLSSDFQHEINKVCLNLEGNGRMTVQGHKYVFSAESVWDQAKQKWSLGMGFALHGQEVIELDLARPNQGFLENFQQKLLKEKTGIDPKTLQLFMNRWAAFINEVITLKKGEQIEKPLFAWQLDKQKLVSTSKIDDENLVQATFTNPDDRYFSRTDFLLMPQDAAKQIKIELIVRKCLD